MKSEEHANMSEDLERKLMLPEYEGADARDGESHESIWRVHVYTNTNPRRPYVSFDKDDRNSAVRMSTDIMINGIVDLDGEFIPRNRIHKIWIQEPRTEWEVQGD